MASIAANFFRNLMVLVFMPTPPFLGVNRGTIENCYFDGHITAIEALGGIAGYNEATGIIRSFTAFVSSVLSINLSPINRSWGRTVITKIIDIKVPLPRTFPREAMTFPICSGKRSSKKSSCSGLLISKRQRHKYRRHRCLRTAQRCRLHRLPAPPEDFPPDPGSPEPAESPRRLRFLELLC